MIEPVERRCRLTRRVLLGALALLLAAPARAGGGNDAELRPGLWRAGQVPDGWLVKDTAHHQVQSQVGARKLELLAGHVEAVWRLCRDFLPALREPPRYAVKVFRNRQGYLDYGSPPESIAHYDPATLELVAYDTGVILGRRDVGPIVEVSRDLKVSLPHAQNQRLIRICEDITDAYAPDLARLLAHEVWHQYYHLYTVSSVRMPAWLDEGLGDYIGMATFDPNVKAAHGFRLGDLDAAALRVLQRAAHDQVLPDFATLLGYAQADYVIKPDVSYAQGWSMVRFLLHHGDPAKREIVPRLLKDFRDTKNFPESTDRVFGAVDLEALDVEWRAWVDGMALDDPVRELAVEFGNRIHPEQLRTSDPVLRSYIWHHKRRHQR